MFDPLAILSFILTTYIILRDMSQRYTGEQILMGCAVIMAIVHTALMLGPRWLRWMLVAYGMTWFFAGSFA